MTSQAVSLWMTHPDNNILIRWALTIKKINSERKESPDVRDFMSSPYHRAQGASQAQTRTRHFK